MIERLGVDIGGVIIDRVNDNTDTSFFGPNYLMTTEVPRAIETISVLNRDYFKDEVYLVSKAGLRTREKTLEWLESRDFFNKTRIPRSKVHFCFERSEKHLVCQELLITSFIDDHPEVMINLKSVTQKYLFNPQERLVKKYNEHLKGVWTVKSWEELLHILGKEELPLFG